MDLRAFKVSDTQLPRVVFPISEACITGEIISASKMIPGGKHELFKIKKENKGSPSQAPDTLTNGILVVPPLFRRHLTFSLGAAVGGNRFPNELDREIFWVGNSFWRGTKNVIKIIR
jgi:hypothetical protein